MPAVAAPRQIPTREQGYVSAGAGGYGWWGSLDDVESAPEVRWPASVGVYDRMRHQDAQVVSVLRAVKLPLQTPVIDVDGSQRSRWRLDPAGCSDAVVDLVAEDLGLPVIGREDAPRPLRRRGRFVWGEHLALSLLHLDFGHAFFEQRYEIDAAGFARLRKLALRPSRTIAEVKVATDGGLDGIRQHAWGPVQRAADGQPRMIPVSRLVAYVNEREGSNWLGMSLLRSAYKNWLIKDRLLRVQAQTIERNGMGVPVYTAGDPAEDLTRGQELASSYRSGDSAGAALPNGATLDLKGVDGQLPDADKPIRYHDEQIARAVLAHFLNLGTQTGSWALGTTFADFFTMSLNAVGQTVAETATAHVLEDIVDINFGETEPAPQLVFEPIRASDTKAVVGHLEQAAGGPDGLDQVVDQAQQAA